MSAPATTLARLERWFAIHCDGVWEHQRGVQIESCDNPGWWVQIDLADTPLARQTFDRIAENVDSADFQLGPRWFCCSVKNGTWNGAGDETTLDRILTTFLDWADACTH